jgi:hypothetical protein
MVVIKAPNAEQVPKPAVTPPRVCEIRQRAWCIYQEGAEITDHQKIDGKNPNEHIWSLRDVYHPQSVLVIFEPEGCRKELADVVSAQGFDQGIEWQGKTWDQMRIRLRTDGSCDLRLLVPKYNKDPLEWAFSVGRALLAACADDACTGIQPTIADVTDKYKKQFKREE